MPYENIREESLKLKVAADWFTKFDCTDIIGRIDFAVRLRSKDAARRVSTDTEYLLWAEAKQQPTDTCRMLAQLIITIKADAYEHIPPKFVGCFDNEKISFVPYHDIVHIFNINDFNWKQTPSSVDDKTIDTVRQAIKPSSIVEFYFDTDAIELKKFIKANFIDDGNANMLSMLIDKNNFIFVYQKWRKLVMPHINADWELLKKNYAIYDRDFFLAELNIDDNGTTDISDDHTVNSDFYITFIGNADKPYQLLRKDDMGLVATYQFGFRAGGKEQYVNFWKRYKRPPQNDYWQYIVERLDLLVPQDVRERKGAFFTPQIWVEKSQEYIADVLGADWQDEYYVWDCCAGTGNLLNGLTNKIKIYASTLDQQDVEVMKERIRNGANLLENHVFQFDFLNDDFSKCPQSLQEIIKDHEKRRKLVIYINPPYAEGDSRIGKGRSGVAVSQIQEKYSDLMGYAKREIFIQFMTRIAHELQYCRIANFATLKALCAPNFAQIRRSFQAKLEKLFLMPADSFDNVKGQFPIGFHFWNTAAKEYFKEIKADVFDSDGKVLPQKLVINYDGKQFINDWTITFTEKNKEKEIRESIANIIGVGNDFQHQNTVVIENPNKKWNHQYQWQITGNNLIESCIYFSVRWCIKATWLNDRDQFLFPDDGWNTDNGFMTNCLVYTLFHGQNKINSKAKINHWIPFTESEVDATEEFASHFMSDYIKGKRKTQETEAELFSNVSSVETRPSTSLQFTPEAQTVMNAGRELWRYYHRTASAQTTYNQNASLYDIKEYFQGRNDKGKMNATSTDAEYTRLLSTLKDSLRILGEQIRPKVYEYGFLK